MIWSFLEGRGVTCRSHLINLMTIGRDRIKKSKDKVLSMHATAKSVSLFLGFPNGWSCCLEIKHSLDFLAFLLFPYPDVHFALCPFAVGRCGAEPQLLTGSSKESGKQIPPHNCCPTGIFLEQKTKWLPICQWQKVLWAVLEKDPVQGTVTAVVFLHWVAVWLLVRSFKKRIKETLPK